MRAFMTKVDLDKIDLKILAILQADGRLTNQEIAEKVNLSPHQTSGGIGCDPAIRRLT
jgi:DNA-binding Lrp family transcriptional regulator